MTRRICQEVEALIDREVRGLSEAERLLLEQHLVSCASCRGTLHMARHVRATIHAAPFELSETSRTRNLARAFARTDAFEVQSARRSKWLVASGLVASAAAAALAIFATRPPQGSLATRAAPQRASAVVSAAQEPVAPTKVLTPAWIETQEAEQHTFAHARVQLEKATRARFDEASTTLELDRGRAEVDVDASQGKPFSVRTQRFRVEVLGTRFVVTPETVHVERGRVQVFAPDGSVLTRELGAGASFSLDGGSPEPERVPGVPARTWLSRARDALAQGDTKAARELVARAEDSDPHRSDRAEAGTLRAEAALLDHDASAAIRHYLSVAGRFSDLVAGENAAFAAAQLAARAKPEREQELLERYLARYPHGRFASEAETRLRKAR